MGYTESYARGSDRMSKDILRIKGIKENRVFTGPKSINLHITSICNLNCSYCWFHSSMVNKRVEAEHMDFTLFKRLIDDFRDLGVESLTLSGEGEPTLHPRIRDMINYIKGMGFRLKILTNGTFGKDIMKYIFKADSVIINLATLSPEKYKKLQSESSCKELKGVIENIVTISRVKKKMGLRKPEVNIGFVINEENYSEIEKLFSFALNHNIGIRFRLMKTRGETKKLILSERSADKLRRSLEDIIKKDKHLTNAKNIYTVISRPGFLKKTEIFYPFENCRRIFYYNTFTDRKIRCYMGWYFSHIDMKGNVRFCCQNPFLIAGNIKQNSFKKIWNSKEYMELRLRCKAGVDTNKYEWMECRYCPFAEDNRRIQNLI